MEVTSTTGRRRPGRTVPLLGALAVAVALACHGSSSVSRTAAPGPSSTVDRTRAPLPSASVRLPDRGGRLAPALTRTRPGVRGVELARTDDCGGCHQAIAADWSMSAHAWASFSNPIYRASIDALRRTAGNVPSRACGGCHDPALLVDGALDGSVAPDDPRSHAGVACRVCHGARRATEAGNGSLVLSADAMVAPADASPDAIVRHKAAMAAAPLDDVRLCGACHRAFLGTASGNARFFQGPDDLGEHQRSAWAGSHGDRVPSEGSTPRDCRGCHMAPVTVTLPEPAARDGKVASHRFPGGHRWLGELVQGRPTAAALPASPDTAPVVVDVGAVRVGAQRVMAPVAPVTGDGPLEVDVVVTNVAVGHAFPGGTKDIQDTWLEIEIVRHGVGGASRVVARDDRHQLRAVVVDADGQRVTAHTTARFATVAADTTIPPGASRVVRYAVAGLPRTAAGAIGVRVRLLHRTRDAAMQAAACAATRGARGAAFSAGARRHRGAALAVCAAQTTRVVATTAVAPSGAVGGAPAPDRYLRLIRYGDGLSVDLPERLAAARVPLLHALSQAGDDEARRARALVALAAVAGRQGQTDEATRLLARARGLVGPTAAGHRVAGDALAAVWRWPAAAEAYERAAKLAPRDDRLWARLALAEGSAGRPRASLEAARKALALNPHHPEALRAQALGARAVASTDAPRALAAHQTTRAADDAPVRRRACDKNVPGCREARLPVPTYWLRSK